MQPENQTIQSPVLLLRAFNLDSKKHPSKLKEIQRVFNEFDSYITKYTFSNVLQVLLDQVKGKGATLEPDREQSYIRQLYHFIDKDKNGMVSYREFMSAVYKSETADIPSSLIEDAMKEEEKIEKHFASEFGRKSFEIQSIAQNAFLDEQNIDLKKIRSKILKSKSSISVQDFDYIVNKTGCKLTKTMTHSQLKSSFTMKSDSTYQKDVFDDESEDEEIKTMIDSIEAGIEDLEKQKNQAEANEIQNAQKFTKPDELIIPKSLGTSMETKSIVSTDTNPADIKSKFRQVIETQKHSIKKLKKNEERTKDDLLRKLGKLEEQQEKRLKLKASEIESLVKSNQQMNAYAKALEENVAHLESKNIKDLLLHLINRGATEFVKGLGAQLQEEEKEYARTHGGRKAGRGTAKSGEQDSSENRKPAPAMPTITQQMIRKVPQLIKFKSFSEELKTHQESMEGEINQRKEEAQFYRLKSQRLEKKMKEIIQAIQERISQDKEGLELLISEEDKGEDKKEEKKHDQREEERFMKSTIKLPIQLRKERDQREQITELCRQPGAGRKHNESQSQGSVDTSQFHNSQKSNRSMVEGFSTDYANLASLTTQSYGHKNAKFFVDQYVKEKQNIFSCKVFYYKEFAGCQQRILLIEGTRIYFFHPNSYQLIVSHPIAEIEQVLLITQSAELIMLVIKNYHPYLLQTLHRIELASFLSQHCQDLEKSLRPRVVEGLILTKGGFVVDGLLPSQPKEQQKSFEISGLLSKFVKSISLTAATQKDHLLVSIQKSDKSPQSWTEKIVALSELGIIVFEDFKDQQPYFFPLMNAKLSRINRWDLKHFPSSFIARHSEYTALMIHLEQLSSLILAFPGEREITEWISAIEDHQQSYKRKERSLLKNSNLV